MDRVDEKINIESEETENQNNIESETLKEFNTLNISLVGLILVFLGVIINIRYILWSRIGILDTINNTNYAEQIGDLTQNPRISNRLYLIATIMFVFIIYDQYRTQISMEPSQIDQEDVNDAWRRYVAIILFLVGTLINYSVLNK
ncbi:hypothetical protein [uncultured Clostridium sp.]|uniref:hypothetical protein n=1 Tax=uncultured Clostridium sp. TaxID=59620 RepID=UPI0025F1075D|nr:hypothetical protein [uncultured Clostridium sp.]